jgi:DNA repair protein RAD7
LDIEVVPDSDHLDSEDEVPTGRKRKASKAVLEKQKMAAKKRAKKHKDDDDDYEDGEEDEYTALSKSLRSNKSSNAKPSVGSLEKCAKCSKQFTAVRTLVVMWPSIVCLI